MARDIFLTDLKKGFWNGYRINNVDSVIEALGKHDWKYYDNHNGGSIKKLDGYIVVKRNHDGENYWYIAATCKGFGFSVNPLYVDEEDEMVHLSTRSIGGVMKPGEYNGSMEKAISKYNEEHQNMLIKCLEEEVVEYVDLTNKTA